MAEVKLAALEKKLLHYTGLAIERFGLIGENDRVLIGLSGGKDSLALVRLLHLLRQRAKVRFFLKVVVVEQNWPGWRRDSLENWLIQQGYQYHFENTNIAQIVSEHLQTKLDDGQSRIPCMLCSRMRRGVLYRLARESGYTKLALGHHRDDLISSLLMSICYNGRISSMPPKLLNDQRDVMLIRPLVYCQERDIANYVAGLGLPVCSSGCGVGAESMRSRMRRFIGLLANENNKVPSNILHALEDVRLSQLMDRKQFNFMDLDKDLVSN